MSRKRILLIDDDPDFFQEMEFSLSAFSLEHAATLRSAAALLQSHNYDLVLLDMNLRGESRQAPTDSSPSEFEGLRYISVIRDRYPILPIIVMSKHRDHALVKEAMRQGAKDYFYKPDVELEVWRSRINELAEAKRLREEQYPFEGVSEHHKQLKSRLLSMRSSDEHLLFSGEIGVGKTTLVRYYHNISKRAFRPFQILDITSYEHESQVEAFLEHVKGGVVYIRRIDQISARAQSFLYEHIHRQKAGGASGDIQFLASTTQNLKEMVQEERFRADLFYSFQPIDILPLRQRLDDIEYLLDHYIRTHIQRNLAQTVTPEAKRILLNYEYPNNARELISTVSRMLAEKNIQNKTKVDPECLPKDLIQPTQSVQDFALSDFRKAGANTELAYIEQALQQTYGQKRKAADLLGVKLDDLRYTITKYQRQFPDLFDRFPTITSNYKLKIGSMIHKESEEDQT